MGVTVKLLYIDSLLPHSMNVWYLMNNKLQDYWF